MAERKSVNKYYPPDWDPSKGSVNKYVGQHPLRDRAKKLGQGILVIRFELPYNIWCGGCDSHVGMGVRYNAEKTKTGNYYSTPIYKFRMKCHLCDNYFEIQTDPKNHDYVILEGARRKEQRWDPKENEQIVPEDKATQKKMATDPMFKLEHGSDDVERGKKVKSNLSSLEVRRDEWKDDYMLNKMARNKFREEKKTIKAVEASDTALLTKSSLGIPLVKEREEDVKLASLMKYRTVESYEEKQNQKRKEIESRPLFQSSAIKPDEDKHESKKLDILKKNLKTAKTISHTSPFDRTKMNTFVTNSPLNKISLGIRKKPMPSITRIIKQRKCVDDSDVKSNQNTEREQQSIETCRQYHTGDLKNISTMDNFQNPILETNLRNGSNNEETTNNTSADVDKIVTIIESDSTDSLEEGVTVLNDEGKCPDNDMHGVGKLDNGQILSGYRNASSKTGLSLVSSYSDSDTDS